RFVIRAYSPARTVGGGVVIEPLAPRRRRHAAGLEALAVEESGSLEARVLERPEAESDPIRSATLARALSAGEAEVVRALEAARERGRASSPLEGRWLAAERWDAVREMVLDEVAGYTRPHPARFGIPKGELRSGLKQRLESATFDAAFDDLVRAGTLAVRSDRVRPAATAWEPPPATQAALERLEALFDAAGFAVPDNAQWQSSLG